MVPMFILNYNGISSTDVQPVVSNQVRNACFTPKKMKRREELNVPIDEFRRDMRPLMNSDTTLKHTFNLYFGLPNN
jgi:hypothetical protein